jgi:hypothetical protein
MISKISEWRKEALAALQPEVAIQIAEDKLRVVREHLVEVRRRQSARKMRGDGGSSFLGWWLRLRRRGLKRWGKRG